MEKLTPILNFIQSIDWAFLKEIQWEAVVGAITLIYFARDGVKERVKLREQEEKEMYKDYKKALVEQLDKISGEHQRQLHVPYNDMKALTEIFGSKEKVQANRRQVFNLFDLMSDIELMYFNKMGNDNIYWKRFDSIFKYICRHPYYVTAFFRFKEKHSVTNSSFIEYIENIIKFKNKEG